MLPSKMAPQTKSKMCSQQESTTHAKKKSRKATVEEVEDKDSPQNMSACNQATSPDPPTPAQTITSNTEKRKKVCTLILYLTSLTLYVFQKGRVKWSNPIYIFYEVVYQNTSGQPGDPGDKHYCCCHGNHKIPMVTKLMKSNLNGSDSDSFFSMELYDLLIFNRAYQSLEAFPHHV